MLVESLLALVAFGSPSIAIPTPRDTSLISAREVPVSALDVSQCPGYAASNVEVTDSGLTADLTLAGPACNAFSDDLKDLKLLVEYQTGKFRLFA